MSGSAIPINSPDGKLVLSAFEVFRDGTVSLLEQGISPDFILTGAVMAMIVCNIGLMAATASQG